MKLRNLNMKENKKGQAGGWGAFIALAIFLLLWSVTLGTSAKVNSSQQDTGSMCLGTNTWNVTAQQCYNVLSVANYSAGTSNTGFVYYNMSAGNINAAGQTTTLTSVGIGVGIITLVLGVIFLVRKSGVM